MTKLPTISASKLIRKLLKSGFQDAPIKGKGSHRALIRIDKDGKPHLVIIPKEIQFQKVHCFLLSNRVDYPEMNSSNY